MASYQRSSRPSRKSTSTFIPYVLNQCLLRSEFPKRWLIKEAYTTRENEKRPECGNKILIDIIGKELESIQSKRIAEEVVMKGGLSVTNLASERREAQYNGQGRGN